MINLPKKIIVYFLLISIFLLFSGPVKAKLLPRFRLKSQSRTSGSSAGRTSVKLRSDRRALIVNFNQLDKVKNISYSLIYQTGNKDEGIGGSIDTKEGNSVVRELLFGTCSYGACRYHTGISNMRLEILTTLANGKKTLKRYRIKV